MSRSPVRDVVFPPRGRQALLRGIDAVVAAIRPTLGPLPRTVAVTPPPGSKRPIELLDDGGLIARRIVALPDRDEDVGAMLVRHVAWRVRERVGDGSATAAVLFRAVVAGGVRAIEAGADPGRLRAGLERGQRVIVEELVRLNRPLDGQEALRRLAISVGGDAPLAAVLAEVCAVIGIDGDLDIRPALDQGVGRQLIDGTYWEGGLLTRDLSAGREAGRVLLSDATIAITDLEVDSLPELAAFLDRTRAAGARGLVIVARRISERALGPLVASQPAASRNGAAGAAAGGGQNGFRVVAVRTPGTTPEEQFAALDDMALLGGGRPVLTGAGQTLAGMSLADLGRARQAWATPRHFGLAGGAGEAAAVQARGQELRRAAEGAATADERERLRRRLGKLMAKTAVVTVGGASEPAGKARRDRARRTAAVLREAWRGGLLPGGGTALLLCRERLLQERAGTDDPDQRAAFTILLTAIEAPFRVIVANAGHNPERCLNAVAQAPPGHGFDAIGGNVADMLDAGIADAATVQRAVVEIAISAAAQVCTIGVLVHPRRREESNLP